jgi:hypothetical protein
MREKILENLILMQYNYVDHWSWEVGIISRSSLAGL